MEQMTKSVIFSIYIYLRIIPFPMGMVQKLLYFWKKILRKWVIVTVIYIKRKRGGSDSDFEACICKFIHQKLHITLYWVTTYYIILIDTHSYIYIHKWVESCSTFSCASLSRCLKSRCFPLTWFRDVAYEHLFAWHWKQGRRNFDFLFL